VRTVPTPIKYMPLKKLCRSVESIGRIIPAHAIEADQV
jgi:hypothetical protein